MYHWHVTCETPRPLPGLPRLGSVASETILSPSYQNHGRFRTAETHCLFKYTLRGEGIFLDADGEHRVPEGHGFLCTINDVRTAYYYPPGATAPWTFVWVVFDGDAARRMTREIVRRYGAIYTLPRACAEVQRLLEFRKAGRVRRTIAPAWGARVVTDLLLALAGTREEAQAEPEDVLVRRARQVVAERVEAPLTVTEVAGRLNVSREHLTRRFAEQTGLTPHDYILRQKLLLACQLLKETTLSNKQVAQRLGFGEPSHFTRTFRRVLQMPPSRFRALGTIPMAWRGAMGD
jgi:AraC-like DNA-binding protein